MIVDLSVPINQQTPVYPGDPAPKIAAAGVLDKDGFNDHYISLGTHLGTHIDAPWHMLPDAKKLDAFPIEHFVGRGRLITASEQPISLDMVQTAGIQAGDIVLIATGMSAHYGKAAYFEDYPVMPAEVAEYLVAQKVKLVGVDTCSVDHEIFINHKILLAGDVLIAENLTNLPALAGHEFTVYALPLKLQLDGAPARIIAQLT